MTMKTFKYKMYMGAKTLRACVRTCKGNSNIRSTAYFVIFVYIQKKQCTYYCTIVPVPVCRGEQIDNSQWRGQDMAGRGLKPSHTCCKDPKPHQWLHPGYATDNREIPEHNYDVAFVISACTLSTHATNVCKNWNTYVPLALTLYPPVTIIIFHKPKGIYCNIRHYYCVHAVLLLVLWAL